MKTVYSIQALRAVAAIAVAIFHLKSYFLRLGYDGPFVSTISAGWVGVDLFFVISGFIMWMSTTEQTEAPRFLYRRLTRIYTSLWPALLIFIVLAAATGAKKLDLEQILSSITLMNVEPRHDTHFLYVTWTLTYEMTFYIVFSLLLAVGRRYAFAFAAVTVLLIELSIYAEAKTGFDIPKLFSSRPHYEFLIGAISAHFAFQKQPNALRAFFLVVGLALLSYGVWSLATNGRISTLLFIGCGTAAILFAVPLLEKAFDNAVGRGAARVGDWSYAIYLLHPSLIYLTIFGDLRGRLISSLGPEMYAFVYAATLIFLSWLYYRYIETLLLAASRKLPLRFFAARSGV